MAELRLENGYRPLPPQKAFRASKARFRAFGGAMGGGKTRALCEEVFDMMLDHPGIAVAVVRQKHTAIVETTRKTFFEQVLPAELRTRKDLVRVKQSQGEDLCEFLWNGSKVMFVGLDDPGKFFSAEFGAACFDEAHEIDEKDVVTVNTRLRQRCVRCVKNAVKYRDPADVPDCDHYPHSMVLTFNPSHPGHWLQQWFILGAVRTDWGFRKDELIPNDSEVPIGDGEFFLSRATDNKYLPKRYVELNLKGMPEMMRRRYLDGLWEHISGEGFFDQEALSRATQAALEFKPLLSGEPAGDPSGMDKERRPQISPKRTGRMEVFKAPVRLTTSKEGDEIGAHRYVVAVDASSGASADWSAIQVLDVDEFEQAAEWQGKVDPDKLADLAFLTACVYNGATIVPEVTGGWGFAVTKNCQKLIAGWQGQAASKPRLYTRPVTDRLSDQFTTLLGWDTNRKTRAHMLTVLEEALREGSVRVHGQRTLAELAAFAFPEYAGVGDYKPPRAQKGAHDDLTVALAIAVAVAERLPKKRYSGPLTLRLS